MSNDDTPKPIRTRLPKGTRAGVSVRFPAQVLEELDRKAKGAGLSRNDGIIAAVETWKGQAPNYADAAKPKAKAKAKPPVATAPGAPVGSRLDKSTIGKRIGPKKGKTVKLTDDDGV